MRHIAEYKRESPWDGPLTDLSVEEVLRRYDADPTIWAISLVIDPKWNGEPISDLRAARRVTKKPILVKAGRDHIKWKHECMGGWHLPNLQEGADFCLDYFPDYAKGYPSSAWLEVHHPSELPDPVDWPLVIVANNRDIETGEINPKAANQVLHHVKTQERGTLVCAASGYSSFDEIPESFDMGLIGTALLQGL